LTPRTFHLFSIADNETLQEFLDLAVGAVTGRESGLAFELTPNLVADGVGCNGVVSRDCKKYTSPFASPNL